MLSEFEERTRKARPEAIKEQPALAMVEKREGKTENYSLQMVCVCVCINWLLCAFITAMDYWNILFSSKLLYGPHRDLIDIITHPQVQIPTKLYSYSQE